MILRFLLRFFYSFSFHVLEAPERPTSLDLFQRAAEAGDKLRELRSTPADRRGDTFDSDLRAASAEVVDLDRLFENARSLEQYEFELTAMARGAELPEARGGDASGQSPREARTAGDIVTQTADYLGELRARGDAGGIEVRNLLASGSDFGSGSQVFVPVGTPYLANGTLQRRRLFVRDLIPVQQTGLASVPYIQEINAFTNETGAATVKEGSAKPEVTAEFTQADAPLRKIAAWIQVTMEALEDAPTLAGYINTRLSYMVLLEEEDQILQGNGTAPNISGILDQSGIQTQTATNNDVPATIADAVAKVELKDGMADGVAMNPGDYWASISERRSTHFDGEGFANGGGSIPFGAPPDTLWGLPVVRTRTLASLTCIVGCWGIGATIFEKGGVRIKSTDSHASLFISNTEVVLAEKRTGLAVHRPDWFVNTTLDITA
jgi:HK97 family phage major capsid protein